MTVTNVTPPEAEAQAAAPVGWSKPEVREICLGMEVTSYESADIDILD